MSNPEPDNQSEPQASVTWLMQMTRVAVYDDGSPSCPRLTEDLLCEDGRGLLIVNALSVRMGVDGNAQGRAVWADIPWTGQDIPGQPEIPAGFASATRETELTTRSPAMTYSGQRIAR